MVTFFCFVLVPAGSLTSPFGGTGLHSSLLLPGWLMFFFPCGCNYEFRDTHTHTHTHTLFFLAQPWHPARGRRRTRVSLTSTHVISTSGMRPTGGPCATAWQFLSVPATVRSPCEGSCHSGCVTVRHPPTPLTGVSAPTPSPRTRSVGGRRTSAQGALLQRIRGVDQRQQVHGPREPKMAGEKT